MISILIVEDSKHKLNAVNKLLTEDLMVSADNIDAVEEIKSAKKLLMRKTYDLLILDLVLPLEQGDDPTAEKGIGFLKDLETSPTLLPPIHIIGLTEFKDMQIKYKENFEKHLWHLIDYSAIDFNWQEKLRSVVYHLITIRKRFYNSLTGREKFDIALITALNKPEFEKILELPVDWQEFNIENDPTKYYKGEITKGKKNVKILAACVEQMGMTATTLLSSKIIHLFNPKYILMGGICAGLKEKELSYGDIIIAEQSWDYGSGKMKDVIDKNTNLVSEIIFEPDPRPIQLVPLLKSKVNSFLRKKELLSKIQNDCKYNKPNTILKAEMGPVASGSYVISSSSKLAEIKSIQRKLAGVEMEGYGLYYACEQNQDLSVKGIMIKSVSDYGDSSKNDQYQDYSAYTSAWFIYYFILEELI